MAAGSQFSNTDCDTMNSHSAGSASPLATVACMRIVGCVSKLVATFVCRALTFFERLPKCAILHTVDFVHSSREAARARTNDPRVSKMNPRPRQNDHTMGQMGSRPRQNGCRPRQNGCWGCQNGIPVRQVGEAEAAAGRSTALNARIQLRQSPGGLLRPRVSQARPVRRCFRQAAVHGNGNSVS